MNPKLLQKNRPISAKELAGGYVLFILHEGNTSCACDEVLNQRLKRTRTKLASLKATPVTADLPDGGLASWVMLDSTLSPFDRHALLRKALAPLLAEHPATLHIAVSGREGESEWAAKDAAYVALINGARLPSRKSKQDDKSLARIVLHGSGNADFAHAQAVAAASLLTRSLTMTPPNELTPGAYRQRLRNLAAEHGWKCTEYDLKKLRKLGAGAFVAVAQGSGEEDAAIVHLCYAPEKARQSVALVGKGICFDTGGHNLKPAKAMLGMHEDMNGSAVALGILQAVTALRLPIRIDCWLALAQNHLGPAAYKQNDVVTALNGKTIEIIHTDAEGRMVLADTLTLASRAKPDLMIDFATLTGSMITALGNRMSGVLGNRADWLDKAVAAGRISGERVVAFPLEADYDEDLDSAIADIKQCTMDSDADHILAARFLAKFIEHDTAWLHVDLSACNRKGGLGAVGSDATGFGVAWGMGLLEGVVDR